MRLTAEKKTIIVGSRKLRTYIQLFVLDGKQHHVNVLMNVVLGLV